MSIVSLYLSIDISAHFTSDFTDAKDVPNLSPFSIFLGRERLFFAV